MSTMSKDIYSTAKLYLAGISSRKMNYAYFNLSDDVIVLSNSSTGKKGSAHGDRLMNHAVSELSFHMVMFKDGGDFIREMKRVLTIPDDVCYGVHIPRLLALWNNHSPSKLEVTSNSDHSVINIVPPKVKYDPLKHFIGQRVDDFHVLSELYSCYKYTMQVGSREYNDMFVHNSADISKYVQEKEQVYGVLLTPDKFQEPLVGIFNQIAINTVIYDGLSIPCYKQFLSKVRIPYSLTGYFWTEDSNSIQTMYTYTDDNVVVRSIRPNVRIIPLKLNVKLDKSINLQ